MIFFRYLKIFNIFGRMKVKRKKYVYLQIFVSSHLMERLTSLTPTPVEKLMKKK